MSKRLRVMKFGGAALADGGRMAEVAKIVAAAKGPRAVVASAMQGITDLLLEALDESLVDETRVYPLLESLRSRHLEAIEAACPSGDDAADHAVKMILERLERLLYGIAYTGEVTPRLRDLVQSFGERLSVPVLAAAIRAQGVPADHYDAEHACVASRGPFGSARPDLERMAAQMPAALAPTLKKGVAVVTGYYGVDEAGETTVFGRGGSDYVASLVACALKAEAVELWKDVPGFLSADPRAVAEAWLVPELGYDEAAELAHVGAKVLHARAVEPVQDAGIPIHIRCFTDPDAPGSTIRADVAPSDHMVRSIASRNGLGIVRLNGPGMAETPGVAKRVFDTLADAGINILNMSTSQATFALLLESGDAEAANAALADLAGGVIRSIDVYKDRALVAVVGRGLGETPGSAAAILKAVSDQDVNIEMISLGASDIAIDFIIRAQDHDRALRGVHDAFLVRRKEAV